MPTIQVAAFADETVIVEIDINGAGRLTAVRCINNSPDNLFAEVVGNEGSNAPGRKYSTIFLANTTTEIPVPTGIAQRLNLNQDEFGRWDGLDKNFVYPWRG